MAHCSHSSTIRKKKIMKNHFSDGIFHLRWFADAENSDGFSVSKCRWTRVLHFHFHSLNENYHFFSIIFWKFIECFVESTENRAQSIKCDSNLYQRKKKLRLLILVDHCSAWKRQHDADPVKYAPIFAVFFRTFVFLFFTILSVSWDCKLRNDVLILVFR